MKSLPVRSEKGFSLLELLVAFVIMALSLAVLYRASGGTVSTALAVERQGQAVVLATALLNAHDVVPPEGLQASGQRAGMSWTLRSEPYPGNPAEPGAVLLHHLSVRLTWDDAGREGVFELSTLRPQRLPVAGGRTS